MGAPVTASFPVLESPEESAPVPRGRGMSRSVAAAAIDLVDGQLRKQMGGGMRDETRELLSVELEQKFDQLLRELRDPGATTTSGAVAPAPTPGRFQGGGWVVAAALAAVLAVGSFGVTWFELWSVRQDQRANDAYAMVVANWLVIEAHTNYERAHNLDRLTRRIADKMGVDVADIEAPKQTHPPTAIQRRSNDYLLSIGE